MFIEALGIDSENIDESFLQSLVDSKQPEWKKLDYKEKLPFSYKVVGKKITIDFTDEAKKEFLRDVSSFANASGGALIYGIRDAGGGIPDSEGLVGLNIEDQHEEKILQTIGHVIRAGIAPRIPIILPLFIRVLSSKKAYILVIPKSWISPHQVTFNKDYTFWARSNERGKYQLDVNELRAAFLLSETLTERIRKFREERISKIIANETPARLDEGPKVILHLIPLTSFNPAQDYDLTKLELERNKIRPLTRDFGMDTRWNVDGLLAYQLLDRGICESYTQLFRNGIIESVNGETYFSDINYQALDYQALHVKNLECDLIRTLQRYLDIFKEDFHIESPIYLFLTLTGTSGRLLCYGSPLQDFSRIPIDRDVLILPESCINNFERSPIDILKDCFNSLWNAGGFRGSNSYDKDGNYKNKECPDIVALNE